jgi:hypothetical protein
MQKFRSIDTFGFPVQQRLAGGDAAINLAEDL